ncbi:MAG TPA: DUF655 domain-containing protein [Nanoarchaeota archaeon]|nr:DUF655 domain-containing protein [Nanoarchaeota archaeon]
MKDEYAIVLDFLPRGYGYGKPEPIAQVIGTSFFTLLEVVPREGVVLKPGDKVYIGPGKREEIDHIKRRINYEKLTAFAKSELEEIIKRIVEENEERFVEFFNKAQPLTVRLHQLELLPGIGKKHMWEILEERKKQPFKSFEDIKARVKLLPDPKELITKRILMEIKGEDEKYRIFVRR